LARSSPRRPVASTAPNPSEPGAAPDAARTLPRVWRGVEYRRLDDLEAARGLFEFAAAAWPPHPAPGWALGAWAEGRRLAGAVVTERAGVAALLHGPVVVESRLGPARGAGEPGASEIDTDPLEVAIQLVGAAVDTATASGIETVFARPQGLDRVWVRFGFFPVPEVALPPALRGRGGAGLFAYRGGSALWSPRPEAEEALRELPGARRATGDPLRGESAAPPTPPAAPTARRRRRARHAG
jgi:hypothetical protein